MSTTGHEIDPNGVNHPKGYNMHPSGVECIEIIRHLTFDTGCVFKYLFRFEYKDGDKDVKKAKWYMEDFATQDVMLDRRPPAHVLEKLLKIWNTEPDERLKWIWGLFLQYLRSPRVSRMQELRNAVSRI